ncbi:hypothetical protein AB0I81_35245 [Nonomuraea sp. NPDC050404]|uniref:hypothetical protein n=1 Tax=Nonomuraea sp. NPDC050404 TaxID=3155783 RepID=UPI0033E32BA4
MSNGARHALGVLAGLLLPPIVAAGLWYGVGDLQLQLTSSFRISWVAVGVLAATAILLAFLLGSRLSPVASLLGGLAFVAVGVLPFVEMTTGLKLLPTDLLPGSLRAGFTALGYSGMQTVLGVALLVVSLFPSRWRGRVRYAEAAPYEAGPYEAGQWGHEPSTLSSPSPYLPPPVSNPEDTTRPMFRDDPRRA